MIVVSFTELFMQYKVFWFICKAIYRACCKQLNTLYKKKNGADHPYLEKTSQQKEDDLVKDPAKPEEMVKWWWWAPLLLLMVVLICVVMGVQFDMPVGMSLLSIVLAFVFSFLAIQCTGITDSMFHPRPLSEFLPIRGIIYSQALPLLRYAYLTLI
jgi:hypothetical protein